MEIDFTYLIPLAVLAMLIALLVYAEARATIIGRISHMNGVPTANTQVRALNVRKPEMVLYETVP